MKLQFQFHDPVQTYSASGFNDITSTEHVACLHHLWLATFLFCNWLKVPYPLPQQSCWLCVSLMLMPLGLDSHPPFNVFQFTFSITVNFSSKCPSSFLWYSHRLLKWKMDYCLEMTLNLQKLCFICTLIHFIKEKNYNDDAIHDNYFP